MNNRKAMKKFISNIFILFVISMIFALKQKIPATELQVHSVTNHSIAFFYCPNCRENLEPSGLDLHNKTLYFVSDNLSDKKIYFILTDDLHKKEIIPSEKLLNLKTNFFQRNFYQIYRIINPHAWDLEAISISNSTIYFINERKREMYQHTKSSILTIRHNIAAYNRKNRITFSKEKNAGFEGLAVAQLSHKHSPIPQLNIFIANERDPALIYRLRLDSTGLIAHTIDHLFLKKLHPDFHDISGLFYEKGNLYLLIRRPGIIARYSLVGKKLTALLNYKSLERLYYTSPRGYGFAEGLALSKNKIFLAIDSNGRPVQKKKLRKKLSNQGRDGALLILERPPGF